MSTYRPVAARLILIAVTLAGLTLWAAAALTGDQEAAIEKMARLLAEETAIQADASLRSAGYDTGLLGNLWATMPVVRKLETMLYAAETANPGIGADRALALLAQSLAQQYQPLRTDPALANYFSMPRAPVTYAALTAPVDPELIAQTLKAEHLTAIRAMSMFFENRSNGGPLQVLLGHFNLDEREAFRILRTSNSTEDALKTGLVAVPEQARFRAMESTIEFLDATHGRVAQGIAEFDPWRPGRGPGPKAGVGAGGGGAGGGGAGGGSGRTDRRPRISHGDHERSAAGATPPSGGLSGISTEGYRRFVRQTYPTPRSRGFVRMMRVGRGFGGVVVGNRLTVSSTLRNTLKTVRWQPIATEPGFGQLVFELTGRRSPLTMKVKSEDAWAAYALVFSADEPDLKLTEGEGLGLLSLSGLGDHYELRDGKVVRLGRAWQVKSHPALEGLSLADSIALVDGLPIGGFLDGLVRRQYQEGKLNVGRPPSPFKGIHNWRISDGHLFVGSEGDIVVVKRTGPTPEILFTAVGFVKGDVAPGFTQSFERHAPVILRASDDYARFNSFLKALAAYRWAASENIKDPGRPPVRPTSRRNTPIRTLTIGQGDLVIGYDLYHPRSIYPKLAARAAEATRTVPSHAKPVIDKYTKEALAEGERAETRFGLRLREEDVDFSRSHILNELQERGLAATTDTEKRKWSNLRERLDVLQPRLEANLTRFLQDLPADLRSELESVAKAEAAVAVESRGLSGGLRSFESVGRELQQLLAPEALRSVERLESEIASAEAKIDSLRGQRDALAEEAKKGLSPVLRSELEKLDPSEDDLDSFFTKHAPATQAKRKALSDQMAKELRSLETLEERRHREEKQARVAMAKTWPDFERWLSALRDLRKDYFWPD